MTHQPNQKNRVPEATVLALFLCATVGFVSACFHQIAGRGFLQILSLIFYCAMIIILVRYKFCRIRYIIRPGRRAEEETDNTGEQHGSALHLPPKQLDFVVEKAQGRRALTAECVLSLGTLTTCVVLPEGRKERGRIVKQYRKAKTYKYLRNMVGARQCMLVFTGGETDDVKLIIEASEEMEGYLSAVARYNREQKENTTPTSKEIS